MVRTRGIVSVFHVGREGRHENRWLKGTKIMVEKTNWSHFGCRQTIIGGYLMADRRGLESVNLKHLSLRGISAAISPILDLSLFPAEVFSLKSES